MVNFFTLLLSSLSPSPSICSKGASKKIVFIGEVGREVGRGLPKREKKKKERKKDLILCFIVSTGCEREERVCVQREGDRGGKKSKGEAFKNRLHWQSKKTTDVDLIESSTLCGAPKSQVLPFPSGPLRWGWPLMAKKK